MPSDAVAGMYVVVAEALFDVAVEISEVIVEEFHLVAEHYGMTEEEESWVVV